MLRLVSRAISISFSHSPRPRKTVVGCYREFVRSNQSSAMSVAMESDGGSITQNGPSSNNHYDLIVIGGGSGGLACAKEAASFEKKVALLDWVEPSPHGSHWGLGGTCVNVGCIPKKLMHHAALLGHAIEDAAQFGWLLPEGKTKHSWIKLKDAVQANIKSSNWVYRVDLRKKNVQYINAWGSFVDKRTVKAKEKKQEKLLTADHIVIATGLRPKIDNLPPRKRGQRKKIEFLFSLLPDHLVRHQIPGAELGISSDDLFSLANPPGRTFVIGGSYVALECAGFLAGLGFKVSVAIRSIALRGFDQQMANFVVEAIGDLGATILWRTLPVKLERAGNSGPIQVTYKDEHNKETTEEFDTVIWAIGREPRFANLGLENIGLKLQSGKIPVDDYERTSVPNVYAIGDILVGKPELTPVAIQAGRFLARRLFGDAKMKARGDWKMDYENVATTVFTPFEYGCVGFSEEAANEKFGEAALEVYHAFYKPCEFTVSKREPKQLYLKVICMLDRPQKVIGIHYIGPSAGEIMQGFAAAIRCGLTYEQLEYTVGIHPTMAEELVNVQITKRSKKDPQPSTCCG